MSRETNAIRWYQSELEIKNDPDIHTVSKDDIEAVRQTAKGGKCQRVA